MHARYGPASTEQVLGALPVIATVCRRLDIAGIIDRAAPVRDIAHATHGQVLVAMIANRLTSPAPMVHLQQWAAQFAVQHTLGVAPGVLGDDRIARALDALAPVLEQVTGSIGAAAIGSYGIDVSQLHWDMTSISLHGDYRTQDEEYPRPRFGHPKDRRPDLKQIQAGVATAADGSVPVFWRPYDGGAAEVSQVVGTMQALRRLAGPRRFLLVGDSKLLSYPNIAAMTQADQMTFLAPASKAFVPAPVLAACDYDTSTPVDFVAARDAHRPEEQRGRYRVAEDTMTITGPRKRDPTITLRRIFVHSSARAQAAEHARTKKLDRARDDLSRLSRGLGSQHYPTPAKVAARISGIAGQRHVGDYLRTTIGTDHAGKPTLQWSFEQAAIDAEAATDGWYALLTNLPDTVTAADILVRYKNQPTACERRYHDLKGPLAVAPMFLHTNRRIGALIGLVCIALLIFCLIEREARRNLAPATTIPGLYAGRPAKPTASLIFTTLATLRLRHTTDGTPEIPEPTALQQQVLDLLNIDPRTAADPPHPMCELRD